MTSTLRTFVSLTPLLQGPTFIAAGAGPVGQGAGCPTGIHCQVLCAPLGSVPLTAESSCPPLCSWLRLSCSCVLASGAAWSLQGSWGFRMGKGKLLPRQHRDGPGAALAHSPDLCARHWLTESHHLGERGPQLVPAKQGRRRLTWWCLHSDLLCCGLWHCVRNSSLQGGSPQTWTLSTQHTLLQGHMSVPSSTQGSVPTLEPHSSTEVKVSSKADMSQLRAKWKMPVPMDGAALPASWGTTSGLWGRQQNPASATGFTERCQRQSQARWPHNHLCWKDSPSLGEPALHTAGLGTRHGAGRRGNFSILLLIWNMWVSIQGTAGGFPWQWLMQKGMPVCCHKPELVIPPAPTGTGPVQHPRFFTATQDSEYICSMWPAKYFLTKHHRSRFYLQ